MNLEEQTRNDAVIMFDMIASTLENELFHARARTEAQGSIVADMDQANNASLIFCGKLSVPYGMYMEGIDRIHGDVARFKGLIESSMQFNVPISIDDYIVYESTRQHLAHIMPRIQKYYDRSVNSPNC